MNFEVLLTSPLTLTVQPLICFYHIPVKAGHLSGMLTPSMLAYFPEGKWRSDPSSGFALKRERSTDYFLSTLLTAWPTSRTMQVLCIAFCCQALSLVSVSVLLARALLKFLSGAGCCQGWSRFVLCSSHNLSLCLGVNKLCGSIFLQTLKSRSPEIITLIFQLHICRCKVCVKKTTLCISEML